MYPMEEAEANYQRKLLSVLNSKDNQGQNN